jgi:cell wall-associated NlpC family hydrolase
LIWNDLTLAQRQENPALGEYRCTQTLDVWKAADLAGLTTQAAAGRSLRLQGWSSDRQAMAVILREDDYPGWIRAADLAVLVPAAAPYQAPVRSRADVVAAIPGAIAFAKAALVVPHCYRWGGTVAPDYDCSGLVQAAFASEGIWLPRDSYQQEAFCELRSRAELAPGDLIFFGTPERTNHVALYLGEDETGEDETGEDETGVGQYIHCSGYDQGRGKMAIDPLAVTGDPVSDTYYAQLRSFGRIMGSYQPAIAPPAPSF